MRPILIEFVVNILAVAIITSGVLPGIRITGNTVPTLIVVGVIFALVNTIVKPVLRLLSCTLIFFTFGLIIFVIDGAMLALTAALADLTVAITGGRLVIDGFLWAIIGAFVMGVIEAVLWWIADRATPPVQTARNKSAVSARRMNADADFSALIGDDSTPATDGDPFDFYDPNTGKPTRKPPRQ